MKNKLVVWGATTQDERVLIALELLPESNKVKLYTFPESVATDEFVQKMMDEWRNDKAMEFPEGYTESERELMVTENLLPENLKVERGDIIQRAQTEWHFVVLSSKLNEAYHSELDDLKTRVDKIEAFDGDLWGSLKNFWDKVQAQVSDKNLLREHADKLRDATNALFGRLKELRSKLDEDFQHRSKENVDKFNAMLEAVETKIVEGLRLQGLFDELKELQRKFRDTEFTRDHRSKVWERLDGAFKQLKDKRSGGSGGSTYGGGGGGQHGGGDENSPTERLKRRYEGLLGAIEKMDRSIQRDRDELNFQSRKVEHSDGQLEMQIRQAKIKMIEERIRSKEEKLNEMAATKTDLETRIESQKERDSRREERHKLEDAKKAAQEKIAHDIEEAAAARQKDQPKLEKAAEALKSKKEESLLGAIGTALGEALEDVVDTAKAVAEVLEDRLEDAVEDATDKLADFTESVKEAVAEAMAPEAEATQPPAPPEDGADVNAAITEEATEAVVETVEEIAAEVVPTVEADATPQQPVEADDDGPDSEAVATSGPDAVGEEGKTEV